MLIICPNLAIDHTVELPELRPGEVIRATAGRSVAGGKGANGARAAAALGSRIPVLGFVGSDGATRIAELFEAESMTLLQIPIEGRVRMTSALVESGGRVTLINEPGAAVSPADWTALRQAVRQTLTAGTLGPVVVTGSLPPGAPADGYAQLVDLVHEFGLECAVDASGEPLRLAAQAGADLVCPNVSEARSPTGGGPEVVDDDDPHIPDQAAEAAANLLRLGARQAVVTAGGAGTAFAEHGQTRWLPAVPVTARNPIGAGDSFLAGTIVARSRGAAWLDAVRYGMAVGAASVEDPRAGVVDPRRVAELHRQLREQP